MDKHQKYVNEKTMLAYEKYLKDEMFEKARAVILKDGEVAFIKNLSNGDITIPGGGVDEGETKEEAAKREAFEETGIHVNVIEPIETNIYEVKMQIGDVDFKSKRAAYIFLCEYLNEEEKKGGLEGEYEGNIEIYFDDIDKLEECHVSKEAIEKIKEYVNKNSNSKE